MCRSWLHNRAGIVNRENKIGITRTSATAVMQGQILKKEGVSDFSARDRTKPEVGKGHFVLFQHLRGISGGSASLKVTSQPFQGPVEEPYREGQANGLCYSSQ